MKKICVVVGSRANYASIKSVLREIKKRADLELQIVVTASALLDRYGSLIELIEKDGFNVSAKVYMLIEGETPSTMAKSTGLGLLELPTIFENLKPDIVLTIGDRFETMATAIASAYMNLPLAHTMGGEVSGTIDESIRHAITKLAHIHFPACEEAKRRIIMLGERPENVYLVGCPRMDLVKEIIENEKIHLNSSLFLKGVGGKFDLNKPFIILSQHPVTTEYGQGEKQITESIMAIYELKIPAIVLWPNADAGSEDVARGIRKFREHYDDSNFHFFKNIPVETYISLMNKSACIVGNSSSAIREGAFMGVPAINIGTRQSGRQRGKNVIDVDYNKNAIKDAIVQQLKNGKYQPEYIYGDGMAGKRIAEILSNCKVSIQKKISY